MGLFTQSQIDQINKVAEKSKEALQPVKSVNTKSINSDLREMTNNVLKYFKDSTAITITSKEMLHDYVSRCIEAGYAGIDTETTGLDRIKDYIVGLSLYYPDSDDCYIPIKHRVPLFDTLYRDQLTYEDVRYELLRFVQNRTKLIFANADFDLAMIYKDIKVDLNPVCYYDVILAWRCLKEDEKDNRLKALYNKYCLKGSGHPMQFSDFFSPTLFPYCKPEIAGKYAGNDAKITYLLFKWQLKYIVKSSPKCSKAKLERIADLFWDLEVPMILVCQNMHRTGVYLDKTAAKILNQRYKDNLKIEEAKLSDMIQKCIDDSDYTSAANRPFKTGKDFNSKSPKHVEYLLYSMLKIPVKTVKGKQSKGTGKEILNELKLPVTNQILKVRSLNVLINTFTDKLIKSTASDGRIHPSFKSVGADCIVGESIVPTSRGYTCIRDIYESVGSVEATHIDIDDVVVVNKDQMPEKAASVIKYKNYPTIKVTTECGFVIEGTYNHPIMVSKFTSLDNITLRDKRLPIFWEGRYFKNLEDIKIGDYVEIPCNYSVCPKDYQNTDFNLHPVYNSSKTIAKLPDKYTEDFAEFLGMYHADGSASLRDGTYTIAISNDDKDVISRVDYLSKHLFNVTTSHYTAQAAKHEVDTYINCMQIRDIDNILYHGKTKKKIPHQIWLSPKSVINSYIRGMTLDSSVYRDESDRISFELSIYDEMDARLVQYHLASQGILSYKSFNLNKGGKKSPRLTFNADNYILFRDTIGYVESKKYQYTEPCAKNKYDSRRINDSFRLKVKSVEKRINTVYDLHVPETHSFISNGFISHNTGRMSSADPNLQNIPSHATDIRHMFRATPRQEEFRDTNSDNEIKLKSFERLQLSSGEFTDCSDIKVGDIIQTDTGHAKIINICGDTDIVFTLEECNES